MKLYGWIGLLIIGLAGVGLIAKNSLVLSYMTPLSWTGYIMFMDALMYRLNGFSYILKKRREFYWMLPWSALCWLLFEGYDLHMNNWYYVGTPDFLPEYWLSSVWSFATIFPGILLTYQFVKYLKLFDKVRIKPWKIGKRMMKGYLITGLILILIPFAFSKEIAAYMYAFVWSGYVFLLEPINEWLGGKSFLPDLREGKPAKLLNLFVAGIICGLLWEFWNYWAYTKWIYTVPGILGEGPKYFEMPIIGFLGFLPFSAEVYSMQNFLMAILNKYSPESGIESSMETN